MTLPRPVRRATALLPVPLLAILLSGCAALGPNFTSPTAWWSPKSFTEAAPAQPSVTVAEPVDPQWWKLLGDPLLTAMEERLAKANLDVRVAALRVTEARAELGVTQAGGLPAVNADASYARVQQSRKGTQSLTSPTRLREPYDLFQYGFDATWELDFWGHVRRGVEQSAAQLTATEESGRDVMVTAEAELARAYVRLRGVQRKLQITRQNLESSRQSLQLTQARAAGGLTTDLDVANAAAQVATIQAEIPGLEQQQSEFGNALGLLLGEAPQALTVELAAPRAVPPVPPRVPVGVPSELARRRPDIRRAEAVLHAATAGIGVATADFYPRITLGGNGMIQGLQVANLGQWAALAYSIGPTVSLPIFDGGRLTRTLELREAQQQEAAILYQRTVLGALHEVDNALTAYGAEQRRRAQLEIAVQQNRRALALARDRYAQGVTDFLQVLTAQRALLAAEQDLTDSTTTVSTNMVALYKALGGGWQAGG